jgi:hypothetical protein
VSCSSAVLPPWTTSRLTASRMSTATCHRQRCRSAGRRVGLGITVEDFTRLEHVIVSPRGGGFVTPGDDALAALGYSRNVVLSSASFLFVPEIVSQSDFGALEAIASLIGA